MGEFRTLLTGRAMLESPRWLGGRLLVSDWGTRELLAVEPDGSCDVVARVDALPFCFDALPDGSLVITAGTTLLRRDPSGAIAPYADLGTASDKGWNDIVVDPRGNIFANCVGFDFPGGEFAPGIVAHVGGDGGVRTVAEGLAFPNGMTVTPDGSTLIVAESYADRLTAYAILDDGRLGPGRVWAELAKGEAPDGIAADAEGAVWYASVPGRHCVRVREGGEVVQTLAVDRGCFACTLGGPDGRTLYAVGAAWPEVMTGAAGTGQVWVADV